MGNFDFIDNWDYSEFVSFVRMADYDLLSYCLESYGLNYFKEKGIIGEVVSAIISKSIPDIIEKLLNNTIFFDMFIDDDFAQYSDTNLCSFSGFRFLELSTCERAFKELLKRNYPHLIIQFLVNLSIDNQKALLPLLKLKEGLIYNVIVSHLADHSDNEIQKIIINDYLERIDFDNIDVERLFEIVKDRYISLLPQKYLADKPIDGLDIPLYLLDDYFIDDLFEYYNIFQIRNIVNKSIYGTNSLFLNDKVKERERSIIEGAIKNPLLPTFDDFYSRYLKLDVSSIDYTEYLDRMFDFRFSLSDKGEELRTYFDLSHQMYSNEQLYQLLLKLSNEELSNYIIDYHFEEVIYNIMLDMNELLIFYDRGHIKLDKTHLEMYRRIVNIDSLSTDEKIKLHFELCKYDIKSIFYDDVLRARRIVNSSIKNSSLNKDTIKKYKNESLSLKYGVDIYEIDSDDLCAIVKSGCKHENKLPTGYSYSLVGKETIGTYDKCHNYIYDANYLNTDQIMHVYPTDSYTERFSYGSDDAVTDRLNSLLTSDELLDKSGKYNEILIMEKGTCETPIDKDIPSLPVLAVYTRFISDYEINDALKKGVGIVLVRSNGNQKNDDSDINDLHVNSFDLDKCYYETYKDKEYSEERRKRLVR